MTPMVFYHGLLMEILGECGVCMDRERSKHDSIVLVDNDVDCFVGAGGRGFHWGSLDRRRYVWKGNSLRTLGGDGDGRRSIFDAVAFADGLAKRNKQPATAFAKPLVGSVGLVDLGKALGVGRKDVIHEAQALGVLSLSRCATFHQEKECGRTTSHGCEHDGCRSP